MICYELACCMLFNINKWWKFNENYNSHIDSLLFCMKIFEIKSVFVSSVVFIVLVCFQHLLFQFTIYDFDSFWFMCYSPVKYLSSTLFLNEHTRKKGADLSLSFSCCQLYSVDRQIFVSFTHSCCLFHTRVFTYFAISCSACSVPFIDRFLFVRFEKAMKYFYTREEKKRIVAYKNEIEEKSGQ